MESLSKEEKKWIFRNELYALKEKEYISTEHYEKTMIAYHKFHADQEAKQMEPTIEVKPVQKVQKPAQVKKAEKKKLSAEEVRERNISWLLHLGVIFLLIGGLFIATSNWDTMAVWMKSASISFVSLLFFGMAYISRAILKIERTSFAFIVLGSLFLPIFILSVGWFELLGPYFSYTGEGRYILGLISSVILFPIYALLAKNLHSRLFVWFSYIAISVGIGFLLAALQLKMDGFYLGMMIYNALIAICYHWLKNKKHLQLFINELVSFAQINLILSTLLMLAFFNNHIFYSFNILLTAAIYLSMVYVTGKKEFHFVFSLMVVYGVYQLVENSVLDSIGPVIFAIVGAGFLAVPKIMDKSDYWDKVFRMTSAIISSLAFIYISVEGILLRMSEPSVTLFFAYLILSLQFTYLTNVMGKKLFAYLSPIFMAAALYEIVFLLDKVFHFNHVGVPVFLIGFVLTLSFGITMKHSFFKGMILSSRDVGIFIMCLSILFCFIQFAWLDVGLILLLFSTALFLLARNEERSFYRGTIPWTIPLSIGFAFVFFGEEMRTSYQFYEHNLGAAMNYCFASAVLLLIGFRWKGINLGRQFFYIAQGFYTIAIFAAMVLPLNEFWMRPLVLLVGVGMYIAFYRYSNYKWLPFPVAIVALITYYAMLNAIHSTASNLDVLKWLQLPLGAILLLSISWLLMKKDHQLAKGFAWIGHINLPFSLLLTWILFLDKSFWGFIAALAAYWISSRVCQKEWKKKLFLYSAFLSLFFVILNGMWRQIPGWQNDYAFLITSGFIFLFWYMANTVDKTRTNYFFLPFSLIGMFAFIVSYPFEPIAFGMMIVYTAGIIIFIHLIKKDFLVGFPLVLLWMGTIWFLLFSEWAIVNKFMLVGCFGVGLSFLGSYLNKKLIMREDRLKNIDSYTFIAFLFFLTMYPLQTDAIWTELLPGILISALLFMQRKRVQLHNKWIPTFLSGLVLLEPYYTLLGKITPHEIIEVELNILPMLAVIIFLRFCLKGKYQRITEQLQWALLIIVSLFLIVDGVANSTIYDAFILGILSLISMLAGMFLKIKSYFFVGSGVLLLNVFLQTRSYWGNLPWWAYLLIVGSILIGVASYNEWHKQKIAKGEKTAFSEWKTKILEKIKEWK
ncbi:hypothetical protein J2Z40_002916 [Cytobacillus eiseniae]|uniref:DUF2157 domain-containing protein n=1 Tax=Cytobacillus eiseniae TaxID=762947 RepID=A0ABS4RKM1_9BACI|nr:hypothetical protein [Cytobacillus eiseniae]MBP2242342.1 hypothetical protein [Cytobacillus eiseniae]